VLLLKRRDHPDFWQSVTGSLKWGERPAEAARRELFEETGLECGHELVDHQRTFTFEILAMWRHRFAPGVTHNLEHVFSLALRQAAPVTFEPREHSAYQWLPRREAADRVWSWTNRRAILDIVPERDGSH
jgi:dihydroneopterin triphosphate diphosphatase